MENGTEERYNNRQIERMFDTQSKDLKSHIDMGLAPILEQTKKTNGRVTTLEEKQERNTTWRTALAWSGGVTLFFVVMIILPILTWALLQLLNLKTSVTPQAINSAADAAFDRKTESLQSNQ